MTTLRALSTVEAYNEWDQASQELLSALEGSNIKEQIQTIRNLVFNQMMTLWKIEQANGCSWAVSRFYTGRAGEIVAQIYLLVGEGLQEILSVMEQFEVWAFKNGAEQIEVQGRKGWDRKLKPLGYEHNYTSYIKTVTMELH